MFGVICLTKEFLVWDEKVVITMLFIVKEGNRQIILLF